MSSADWKELATVGRAKKCAFIKIESNVVMSDSTDRTNPKVSGLEIRNSSRVFASHTYLLDLAQTEEQLLSNLHQKTRYNIGLAARKGVVIEERNDDEALKIFLKLQKETTDRQHFFVHPNKYYETLWNILAPKKMAYLLLAKFNDEYLGALMLFKYGDTFYYPYGGTSEHHKELMAPSLLMWEAVRLGQKLGCSTFDMWGAAGSLDPKDPWSGFTRFKQGFGGQLVEFKPTYDLVLNKPLYHLLTLGNKLRWFFLRISR
ncbi:MAG: peptidoglycan bridge formation glycyltransferase FemA/FemB family protein [candidate division WWE3 bacterium]|nr:peptidoglycan bridge formation glycyltransferase FemA/FemB family protein [candidate division WWE3 bacterium]